MTAASHYWGLAALPSAPPVTVSLPVLLAAVAVLLVLRRSPRQDRPASRRGKTR